MSMTISFTNYNAESLSKEEAFALGDYLKVYRKNEIIKKIEYYDKGKLDGIEYFKDESENLSNVFSILGTSSVAITEEKNIDNYRIKTSTSYKDGIKTHIEKELTLNDELICVHEIDGNNRLKINDCVKYFYDTKKGKRRELLNFYYNGEGNLESIGGFEEYPFSEYNQSLYANEFSKYFPDFLLKNPYYANVDFLPFEINFDKVF